jgi:hypothetical protein
MGWVRRIFGQRMTKMEKIRLSRYFKKCQFNGVHTCVTAVSIRWPRLQRERKEPEDRNKRSPGAFHHFPLTITVLDNPKVTQVLPQQEYK